MRQSIVRLLLVVVALPAVLSARAEQPLPLGQLDLGVTYAASHANFVPGTTFWLQGGGLEARRPRPLRPRRRRRLRRPARRRQRPSTVPINLFTDTFGPRYTRLVARRSRHPLFLFGQGLIGEAHGFKGTYPGPNGTTSNALSFALQLGGGADLALSPHLTLRVAQLGWLRTQLPNNGSNVENEMRVGAGIVFHTGGGR